MNNINVNLFGYYNKLVNLHNYTQTNMSYFRQNCINFTHFSIILQYIFKVFFFFFNQYILRLISIFSHTRHEIGKKKKKP